MSRSPMLVAIAGGLVLVAVAGTLSFEWFWWSLMPAAALLGVGLLGAFPLISPRMPRLAGLGLGVVVLAALLGSIAGLVTVSRIGVEPEWVGLLSTWTSAAVITTAAILGAAIMGQGRGTRLTGLLLAMALPFGLAVDWGLDMLLPPGFPDVFLLGAGFYLGLGLFGVALIRLGRLWRPRDSMLENT